MKMQCPHCSEEFSAQLTTTMPDEQITYISLKYEGEMPSAQTVAGLIKNTDALMKAVAKDIDFRYVMRTVPVPELGEGIGRDVPVLQWRKKVVTRQIGIGRQDEWTDWQDVRTEEE